MNKPPKGPHKPRVKKGVVSGRWYGRAMGFSVYAYHGFMTWEGAMHYALTGSFKDAERVDYVSRNYKRKRA